MKFALALALSLLVSGCATVSNQELSDNVAVMELAESPAPAPVAPRNAIPLVLVEGTSNQISFREQNEIPVRTAAVEEIELIALQNADGGKATTIAIDASRVRQQVHLQDPTMSEKKKQVSVKEEPNPDYQRAKDKVSDAEQALRSAETSNTDTQEKAREVMTSAQTSGLAALGGLLSVAGTSNVNQLKRTLDEAREDLRSTKQTVSTPVFVNEPQAVATEVVKASGDIVAYVIDSAGHNARSVRIPVDQVSSRVYVAEAGNPYAASTAHLALPPVSVEQIVQQAAASPAVTLAEMADELTAGRVLAAAAATASERQAAQTTAQTLARLAALAPAGTVEVASDAEGKAEVQADAMGGEAPASASAAPGECLTDTSSLAERFHQTGLPLIDNLREEIIAVDIMAAMRRANAQGLSHAAAIQLMFDQVRADEESLKQALAAANAVDAAPPASSVDRQYEEYVNGGRLELEECDGIRNSSLCAAVNMRMGSDSNRMIAHAITCHDRNGTWPK